MDTFLIPTGKKMILPTNTFGGVGEDEHSSGLGIGNTFLRGGPHRKMR